MTDKETVAAESGFELSFASLELSGFKNAKVKNSFAKDLLAFFADSITEIQMLNDNDQSFDLETVAEICEAITQSEEYEIRFKACISEIDTIFAFELVCSKAQANENSLLFRALTGDCKLLFLRPIDRIASIQADPDLLKIGIPILCLPLTFFAETWHLHPSFFSGVIAIAGHAKSFKEALLKQKENILAYWRSSEKEVDAHSQLFSSQKIPGFNVKETDLKDLKEVELNFEPGKIWFKSAIENEELSLDKASEFLKRMSECSEFSEMFEKSAPELKKILGFNLDLVIVENEFSQARYFSLPPQNMIMQIISGSSDVKIEISADLKKEDALAAFVHALAHLILKHILPGDGIAHWDTRETVDGSRIFRDWDHRVKQLLSPLTEKVKPQSLEECSDSDKAALGLWRMISETIGGSFDLHPQAFAYQKAAYQRQAAQRIVAQLEELGGAMLCDGVGLGKTYVATTVIVHYANRWLDILSENGGSISDPFRITILAPNSIVSTWRREALPHLTAHNVSLHNIRVISHSKLSRISKASEVLKPPKANDLSDLEHLLLSDLVIVDEAHNFRSTDARRTMVLRDILRVKPRKEFNRRTVLLTATPVNNSLEDLSQEVSLLFSKPILLSDAVTNSTYRQHSLTAVSERCARARAGKTKTGDVAAYIIHGKEDQRFSNARNFRDDLPLGSIRVLDKYFKEEDQKLKRIQEKIKAASITGVKLSPEELQVRIADELLDRIVIQRSRDLCRQIELQQNSQVELLFRKDPDSPEKLFYSDDFDGIKDVLKGFLELFQSDENPGKAGDFLSLKVYMWSDVRAGTRDADEMSSVVGLQRMLVLKRLESSPVSFFITLLRLTVLHAYRIQKLVELCHRVDYKKEKILKNEIEKILTACGSANLGKIRNLTTDSQTDKLKIDDFSAIASAFSAARKSSTVDNAEIFQGTLAFDAADEEEVDDAYSSPAADQLDRLWQLKDYLVNDFKILLKVSPGLADIVFGRFASENWPRNFIAPGGLIDWPGEASWGLRMVTDSKLRELFKRLLQARKDGMKAIVFSQFADSLAYICSVIAATKAFSPQDWSLLTRGLGIEDATPDDVRSLLSVTEVVTGDTEDRDSVVNCFAPFYRIGPFMPQDSSSELEEIGLVAAWQKSWQQAIQKPVEILFASDVLAEGVNLQDAAMLINFDIHWNPVRMIQRRGRIDRRLNPAIEKTQIFSELEDLANRLKCKVPKYFWHNTELCAPVLVNMLLPDELEKELRLREKIAMKTLAIDFTLGLNQGTGAEADWLEEYAYHGVSSLNSFQKDRAIENLAGSFEKLNVYFRQTGIVTEWANEVNGWFQTFNAKEVSPMIARIGIIGVAGKMEYRKRYLIPVFIDGRLCMCMSPIDGHKFDSVTEQLVIVDGENWPPLTRPMPINLKVDSQPISAEYLLQAVTEFFAAENKIKELDDECRLPMAQQAIAAINTGYFHNIEEIADFAFEEFFYFQYKGSEKS
ncbi:MAG: DEAD/DEAH box helicase [Candidatus Riflebacteria bacterium]